MDLSKRIGELALQLEDLRQARPIAVGCQQAAHGDAALFQAPMPFLNGLSGAEIGRRSRPARMARWWLKERLNVLKDATLIAFHDPEVVGLGLCDLETESALRKDGITADDHAA